MQDFTHGGHIRRLSEQAGCADEALLDYSANINPLGPPAWFRSQVCAALDGLAHYPDPHCTALCRAGAERFGVPQAEVLAGNGSTEILYALVRALGVERAIIPVPAYTDYRRACEQGGADVLPLELSARDGFAVDLGAVESLLRGHPGQGCAVFLGQPNNPTGKSLDTGVLRALAAAHPQVWFVVDEAFADFVPGADRLAANRPANVVVLYSLTKFYAIPGLRLGLGFAAPDTALAVQRLIPPWSVNGLAQAVGVRALADTQYARRTVAETTRLRTALAEGLAALPGLTVYPGEANFLLCHLGAGLPAAPALAARMLRSRIAIRVCDTFEGLDDRFIRLAVRGDEENALLLAALTEALCVPAGPAVHRGRKTPAIMVQGTSSNAGKSILAAALGRILLQDGFDVAPFKSQNMSLNSYVTRDGGEMGRAQVTQAQACRLDPDVRMNPVLLKPNSDTGSQVIVLGKPVANMDVGDYIKYKSEAFAHAQAAYDDLAKGRDVMVLEGAGSPAEINLKAHDIVNMNMARHAGAHVLLAGDIDRGGVFASFVGTMELLEPWERQRVSGYVVNRFRGDARLLGEALEYTTERTGKPFFGVVPYLRDLGLPEEDSVSFKDGVLDQKRSADHVVDIACVDLPHISNFTDLDALACEPDVHVRVVRRASDLGNPHAVILPGSKNVVGDMQFLRDSGLAGAVTALAAAGGCEIVGICGGFQMLGREIRDPHGLESVGKTVQGLGLLPVATELARGKTLVRTTALHSPSGHEVAGYEIHHGCTESVAADATACVVRADGEALGFAQGGGLAWGSYLHGIFDADGFRRWFVDSLRGRHGLGSFGGPQTTYTIEPALDRLAAHVRKALDMKALYRLLGLY